MVERIRRVPSPALVISVIALILAVGGGTFAIASLTHQDKKVVKKIAKNVADKEINKKAPSRGIALAGARITDGGDVTDWFNTLGGKPTVSHTTGMFEITFPGLDAQHKILEATPYASNVAGDVAVDYESSGQVLVQTFNAAGSFSNREFFLVVYDASSRG